MGGSTVKCSDCDILLKDNINEERIPCHNCGSIKRTFEVCINDEAHGYEKIGMKVKRKGIKKPIREVISGDELFKSQKKWVQKERIIDRENNRYYEKVVDPATGEIIHLCDQPLSEHSGHGSAKLKD